MKNTNKTLPLVISLCLGLFCIINTTAQETSLVTSCNDTAEGRCTGSAYCSACKNCSRCRHCSGGGSCGVCSSRYRRKSKKQKIYTSNQVNNNRNTTTTGAKKNKHTTTTNYNSYSNTTYNVANTAKPKYNFKKVEVNAKRLNMRLGPGISYPVIAKLKKGEELSLIAMTGDWVKVKVLTTKKIGFVYYKYLLLTEY